MNPKTHPDKLSYTQIKRTAENFLNQHLPELTLPVPIEEIVEFDLKIELSTELGLKSECDCDGFITSDFSKIIIDDYIFNKFEPRARFTIAHELAHKILHAEIYKNFEITDKNSYLRFQHSISEEDQKWLHRQAHDFAGCVLVPT